MITPGERPTLGAAPPGRLRRLIIAGLIDSFGLSLGWPVFNLHAVAVHGLATVGLFGAAMLTGVALSAPVAGRLAVRVPGRLLLRGTAIVEALLRLVTFSMLIVNAPLVIIAAAIVLMNVVFALSAYPMGRLADRVSQIGILAAGLAVLVAADILLATSQGLAVTAVGVALWGLHMGMTQGVLAAMVAATAPAALRGTAFGVFNLVSGVGLLGGVGDKNVLLWGKPEVPPRNGVETLASGNCPARKPPGAPRCSRPAHTRSALSTPRPEPRSNVSLRDAHHQRRFFSMNSISASYFGASLRG